MTKSMSIAQVRELGRKLEARGVIILVFDDEVVAGTSWGRTRQDCKLLGQWMDDLIDNGEANPWNAADAGIAKRW